MAGIGVVHCMLIRLHLMMLVPVRMLSPLMHLHGGRSGLGQQA